MPPRLAINTNKVANKLTEKLASKANLCEFERAYYFKEADNQKLLECKYSILALIYTVDKNREQARENALIALDCIGQSATLVNTLAVLRLNAWNTDVIKVISRFVGQSYDPSIRRAIIPCLGAFPDIDYIREIYHNILKTKDPDNDAVLNDTRKAMCEYYSTMASTARDMFGISAKEVANVSNLAAEVSEKFKSIINYTNFDLSPSGDWMSLTYRVEKGNFDLVDLNMELADLLIENSLDSIPLVARFELTDGIIQEVSSQYAN